jgi:hypothetical protein
LGARVITRHLAHEDNFPRMAVSKRTDRAYGRRCGREK